MAMGFQCDLKKNSNESDKVERTVVHNQFNIKWI